LGDASARLDEMIRPSDALEIASATHVGMVRSHNEDSMASDAGLGLVVLADGMGGYNAGEVASGIAVDSVMREMGKSLRTGNKQDLDNESAERLIRESAAKANTEIYRTGRLEPNYSGMGTTLVVALWHNDQVTVGHIGDSRCYRLRGETLEQMTHDHSWLQERIDRGMISKEAARHSPHKNLVTRAVGIDPAADAEIHSYPVEADDVYLLCSDGLTDMVTEEELRLTLSTFWSDLHLAAERLVQQANDNGGHDNISVVLVRVRKSCTSRGAGGLEN